MASQEERYEALMKRRQERQEQRRRERNRLMLRLGLAALAVALVAALIARVDRQAQTGDSPIREEETAQTQPDLTESPDSGKTGSTTVIHIAVGGDVNVTDTTVEQNMENGVWDYTEAFLDIAPVLSGADLTLLNLEGTFSGAPYGSGQSSAPPALAEALAKLGVDAVQTANSQSIQGGILGLRATLDALDAVDIAALGTFRDSEEFQRSGGYTIIQVQGLKIALVAFTKGMDNMGLPEGSGSCVNVLYTDYQESYAKVDEAGITAVLERVQAQEPDLTVAMLHWGSEYNGEISSSQKKIKNLMLDNGVDVILGTHSHLLQEVEYDAQASTFVAYSLGDLYGDASQPGTNYSVILDLEITRDDVTGETAITGWDYVPVYTVRPEQSDSGGLRVVRIREAMARYESGYIGRVSQSVYNAMATALERIEKCLNPTE